MLSYKNELIIIQWLSAEKMGLRGVDVIAFLHFCSPGESSSYSNLT